MWKQHESGRVETPTWFEPVILVATLALIPVIIVQRDAHSASWQTAANAANWLIWAVFAAEMAFVLAVAPRKQAALRAHWLDAALVAVTVPAYGRCALPTQALPPCSPASLRAGGGGGGTGAPGRAAADL